MLATIEPRPLRVLVVDDDLDTVDSAAMVLQLSGYEVETAASGREALARLTRFEPDIVMLDIGMPAMDGYDTAREIQRLALAKPPVLIAVSGHADLGTRRRAAETGFDLHLAKPIEPAIIDQLQVLIEEGQLD